jgi:hypothetical protein
MKLEFLLSLVTSLALQVFAQSAAPLVLKTQPTSGDQNVSPGLTEIVITFDQDMASSYSFTGGGPTFPKVAGKPVWRTPRECVLPVLLESGRSYTVGINSATQTNFKSSTGTPADPSILSFKTKAGVAAAGGNRHVESIRQLRDALDHRYSYRYVHRVDWAAAWQQFEPRLLASTSARDFAVTAGEMLAATQDAHIWLTEAGQVIPAFQRKLTPNASLRLLPKLISGWSQRHPMVASGNAAPDVGYIAIHSWERKHGAALVMAALAALSDLEAQPALIIDVRFNSGGDETLAREFAGHFVTERKLYAKHRSLGSTEPTDRWLEPSASSKPFAGRVAVLMGPVNMSSAEAFLLMMRQVPGCRLIGQTSFGASGNPQPHQLANGVTVYLPSWNAMLPDGTSFETRGITPDVEVKYSGDMTASDPVLTKAIEIVGK